MVAGGMNGDVTMLNDFAALWQDRLAGDGPRPPALPPRAQGGDRVGGGAYPEPATDWMQYIGLLHSRDTPGAASADPWPQLWGRMDRPTDPLCFYCLGPRLWHGLPEQTPDSYVDFVRVEVVKGWLGAVTLLTVSARAAWTP